MEKEIFKDIPELKDYQISNFGRVKSLKFGKERIIKPTMDGQGYLIIRSKNIKGVHKIHKLVAIAFLDHVPNGMKSLIDHINSDKTDNRVENLRIVTNRENCSKPQERNRSSKFTGVAYCKNKWRSKININGKQKHLGYFNTELEAHEAYQKALSELS